MTDDKGPPSASLNLNQLPPLQKGNHATGHPGSYATSWIDEIAVGTKREDSALHASLPPGLVVGNLAALEEEPLPLPPPSQTAEASPSVPLAARSSADSLAVAPGSLPPPPPSAPAVLRSAGSGAATGVGVVVALVVAMAAGAAAWFTHLIPHQ